MFLFNVRLSFFFNEMKISSVQRRIRSKGDSQQEMNNGSVSTSQRLDTQQAKRSVSFNILVEYFSRPRKKPSDARFPINVQLVRPVKSLVTEINSRSFSFNDSLKISNDEDFRFVTISDDSIQTSPDEEKNPEEDLNFNFDNFYFDLAEFFDIDFHIEQEIQASIQRNNHPELSHVFSVAVNIDPETDHDLVNPRFYRLEFAISLSAVENSRKNSQAKEGKNETETDHTNDLCFCPACGTSHVQVKDRKEVLQLICSSCRHRFCRYCLKNWSYSHDCLSEVVDHEEREEEFISLEEIELPDRSLSFSSIISVSDAGGLNRIDNRESEGGNVLRRMFRMATRLTISRSTDRNKASLPDVSKETKSVVSAQNSVQPSHVLPPPHRIRTAPTPVMGKDCYCLCDYEDDPRPAGDIRSLLLTCGCTIHLECLIAFLCSALGDSEKFIENKYGVRCLFLPTRGCKEFFTVTDSVSLYQYCKKNMDFCLANETGIWSKEDVALFEKRSFKGKNYVHCPKCESIFFNTNFSGVKQVNCTKCSHRFCLRCNVTWVRGHDCIKEETESLSQRFIEATSKKCSVESCFAYNSHFHGHGCHHIRCPGCATDQCFQCGSTEQNNREQRGSRSRCKCPKGVWHTFCNSSDIESNIVHLPYPHDKRCGCCICPDCRPGQPCSACNGSCVVCRNKVSPGPSILEYSTPVRDNEHKGFKRKCAEKTKNACCR